MDDNQLEEQILYLVEEMDKVRTELNAGDITIYQARLMIEPLQNELYALTGSNDLMW